MHNTIVDVLDIGPECTERFIDLTTLSQMPNLEIELAGCSNLLSDYCVARTNPLEHTLFILWLVRAHLKQLKTNTH